VLEPSGHLRLEQESRPILGVVSVFLLDLLEGDFAVQLFLQRDGHLSHAALCVRPQDAET
jgi:hypothetical protein